MSLTCIKLLVPLFFVTEGIVAQLPNFIKNRGCQNLPASDISQNLNSQPVVNNFPAASNNPVATSTNGNGFQTVPNMNFVSGQISELINYASNVNNRQLMGNNPSLIQNLPTHNNKFQIPNDQPSNLLTNNPYLPGNIQTSGIFNNGNNLINAPNNFLPAASNLPGYNNNLPATNAPFSNLPLNKPPKINSLTLAGEAFNNGVPFNVVPATASNIAYNFVNNNANALKQPRSLPTEATESSYLVSNNLIENNGYPAGYIENNGIQPASWQYNNQIQNSFVPGNVPRNDVINNGYSNNNMAGINHFTSNIPDFISNNRNGLATYNGGIPNSFPMNNINNIQPVIEEFLAKNQIPTNSYWQSSKPISIPEYHNIELPMSNWATGLNSQPIVNNLNLPDYTNGNLLSMGELGNFPIFSGLPVIGITETLSVINPEKFNQSPVLGY